MSTGALIAALAVSSGHTEYAYGFGALFTTIITLISCLLSKEISHSNKSQNNNNELTDSSF